MTIAALTDTDVRIRDAVRRQLEWDPQVDASGIGVTAQADAVTLTGFIDTCGGKLAAERAAKRVPGVRAVANDINVRVTLARTDPDIAVDVARALAQHTSSDSVQAAIHHGEVTLTGNVPWMFQKREAEKVIRRIPGVRRVRNHIRLAQACSELDLRRRIQSLHANANFDASRVQVKICSGRATLTGTVRTWHQYNAIQRAVADAPGVTAVDNCLRVEAPYNVEPPDEIC